MRADRATVRGSVLLALVAELGMGAIAPTIAQTTAKPAAPAIAQPAKVDEIVRLITEGSTLLKDGRPEALKQAIAPLEKAVKLSESANATGQQGTARLLLGRVYSLLNDQQTAIAYYNQALSLFRTASRAAGNSPAQELNQRQGEAITLSNLALVYDGLGDTKKAIAAYRQALPIQRALGQGADEARTWGNLGVVYNGLGESQPAIEAYHQALQLQRSLGDRPGESTSLNNLGDVYNDLGDWQKAVSSFTQALSIKQMLQDRPGEANTRNKLGRIYDSVGERQKAIEQYDQALSITRSLGNRIGEANILSNLGQVYQALGERQKAIEFHSQALSIFRTASDSPEETLPRRKGEAIALNNLGYAYDSLDQKQKAIDFYGQALAIFRALNDRGNQASTLSNLGVVYDALGENQKAIEYYNQALPLQIAVGDRQGETKTLSNLGLVYTSLGEQQTALKYYNQALPIARARGDRPSEAMILNNLGSVYNGLGEKQKAIDYYRQALPLQRAVGDRVGEGRTLSNLGGLHMFLGNLQKALDYYQQALPLILAGGGRSDEATLLNNLGSLQGELGETQKAIEYYQQALPIQREIGDRTGEATTLNNLGYIYYASGDHPKAIDHYNQAISILHAVGNRAMEARGLNNLGRLYADLGDRQKALNYFNQSLPISRAVGDRTTESATLNNFGRVYRALNQPQKAMGYYNQALAIRRALGERWAIADSLNTLGEIFVSQNQSGLAIAFYKQSVNTYESVRQDIRTLPKATQKTYVQSVASTYRTLANLLLEQDRILEAQQVLDLLKVQEIEDYLRNTRSSDNGQLTFFKAEADILQRHGELQTSAIKVGDRLAQLRQINSQNTLTPAQTQELAQLTQLETDINRQFNQFVDSAPIQDLLRQLSRGQQTLNLEDLNGLRDNLKQLNAVLIYPLILEDRLELIITTPNSPPLRRTVPNLSRRQLNQTIGEFRRALQSPKDPAATQKLAQQLYQWLIKPLEADLQAARPQTLIYAPDGALRYIPLATLHDGMQWLAQRYRTNNIIARSLQELNSKPQAQPKLLAGAYGDQAQTIQVGDRSFTFSGIPFTLKEVDSLKPLIPTNALVGKAFNRKSLLPQLNNYNIVHLATHGKFVPGDSANSFIALGSGEIIPLPEIQDLTMANVDLVVLSACETGVGDVLGNGQEILGLGYQFQRAGARATVASLWPVDDGGTQVLMTEFYRALKQGLPKAQALQVAQQALITQKLPQQVMRQRAGARALVAPGQGSDSSHPYYWAPFILLGNGL
jgi:CHAT domain-containing protein/Flp pilus assembly protein TadD